jgi:hypothetical protein
MKPSLVVTVAMIAMNIAGGCTSQEEPVVTKVDLVEESHYTNHLVGENSPYLLSHADNPVDWYPWGEEALELARAEDRPIFLSIGYAACHWCHVMEHESFEDTSVARILNDNFVCIKVDREQRPDLDQIYMSFTAALTGSGGWPMSIFMTPELKPFFAGTYFPAVGGPGRPSFKDLITEIALTYRVDRERVDQSADDIFAELARRMEVDREAAPITSRIVDRGVTDLMRNFDQVNGGFGNQPKFPHALELSLFLRHYRDRGDDSFLAAAELALTAMAKGGIYDQLGGGFARYSTDRSWLVPHFEKMLYDNALLVPVYADAWQLTRDSTYLAVVSTTLDWILREMTNEDGAFYSALDADSEGEEGKFYVWSQEEIEEVLGSDNAVRFLKYYNVSERGNFEGRNILHVSVASSEAADGMSDDDFDAYLADCRRQLLRRRNQRVRPLTDDKILTSWNGLALAAFCRGYQVTGDERYFQAAIKNANFVTAKLWRDGQLTHTYRDGRGSQGQFLEDYAFYVMGLIELYQSDSSRENERWLRVAQAMTDRAAELFLDDAGVFYLRPAGQSDLILRPRDEADGAIPAPGSVMIANLLRLHRLTDEARYLALGEKALVAISGLMEANPSAMTSALLAADYHVSEKVEVVVVGSGPEQLAMLEALYRKYLPNRIIAVSEDGVSELPLFGGRRSQDGLVRGYVCRNSVCSLPVENAAQLIAQLNEL